MPTAALPWSSAFRRSRTARCGPWRTPTRAPLAAPRESSQPVAGSTKSSAQDETAPELRGVAPSEKGARSELHGRAAVRGRYPRAQGNPPSGTSDRPTAAREIPSPDVSVGSRARTYRPIPARAGAARRARSRTRCLPALSTSAALGNGRKGTGTNPHCLGPCGQGNAGPASFLRGARLLRASRPISCRRRVPRFAVDHAPRLLVSAPRGPPRGAPGLPPGPGPRIERRLVARLRGRLRAVARGPVSRGRAPAPSRATRPRLRPPPARRRRRTPRCRASPRTRG